MPALSEFKIRGVVARQAKAFRQMRGFGPRLAGGFFIEPDRQRAQKAGETAAAIGIEAAAPFGDKKPV
jgi:hypothetical protein